jgi:hypothetical protein
MGTAEGLNFTTKEFLSISNHEETFSTCNELYLEADASHTIQVLLSCAIQSLCQPSS